MKTTKVSVACAVILALLASGCAEVDPLRAPEPATGSADFSVLVAVGNSLTMGFQSLGVAETHQRRSYPALIAAQVGKQVLSSGVEQAAPGEFVIPGWGDPGSPGTLNLVSLSPLGVEPIDFPGAPVNVDYPAPYNNLGIFGASVNDVLNTVTSASNPLFDFVLRGQGTMLQQALALDPTFVLLWVGGNDVQGAVVNGSVGFLTPVDEFETDYRQLLGALTGGSAPPGIVAANIPDVTRTPLVRTVPPFLVNPANQEPIRNPVTGALIPLIGPEGPLALPGPSDPGDLVTLLAIPLLAQGYGIPEGLPGSNGQPLPDGVVIDRREAQIIRDRVNDLNTVISRVAAEFGTPLADMASLFDELISNGVVIGGVDFESGFVSGGLFSLDGVHPTDVGQMIVANAFIRVINESFGAAIAPVNIGGFLGIFETASARMSGVRWEEPASVR